MKRFLVSFILVFVVLEVMDMIVHTAILGTTYASMQNVWRPDMMQKMWIFIVVKLVVSFFFVFIFSKGYEGKGILEGIRYGLYMGIMLSVGYAFASYASYPISLDIAWIWFISGIVCYVAAGITVALIFRKYTKAPQAAINN